MTVSCSSIFGMASNKARGRLKFLPSHFPGRIGTLAIAGLPPLNGFVSEWLLLQAFLFTPQIPHTFVDMLVPLGAAALALTVALAGYVMVKFYGVIFLGQPREPALAQAHHAGRLERIGLGWLAFGCVALGAFPQLLLTASAPVTRGLLGTAVQPGPSLWAIAPVAPEVASYSGLVLLVGILGVVGVTFVLVRRLYHGRVRRTAPWDCGYPWQTPRMQDTAEGFGQPIRHIFEPFFRIERELPSPLDDAPHYRVQIEDRIWLRSTFRSAAECSGSPTRWQWCRADGWRSTSSTASSPCSRCWVRAVNALAHGAPDLELLLAIALAPLFMGWIAQCRAWLQNRSAPPLLQP